MREFKDKDGQSWQIELTIGAVLRVKKGSDGRFNLFETEGLAEKLATDEAEFWEVLWHLISPQAKERSIDAERFGDLLAADCLHQARRLFFEAWDDFFLQLHRPDAAAVVKEINKHLAKAIQLVTEKLNSPEMQSLSEAVEQKMRSTLNASFGDLQASLGLPIRGRTRSAK